MCGITFGVQPGSDIARVGTVDWWKRPYREVAPKDPDQATARTIKIMCELSQKSSHHPVVKRATQDALQRFAHINGGMTDRGAAAACWWWCKVFLTFEHHELIIRQHLDEFGHLQGLISPDALLLLEDWRGDCAIYSMLLAAMLANCGIPYEFVTVAANPREPNIFSHVYLYGVMGDGSRLPLDSSHGEFPGWQIPSADVYRIQVWSSSGQPVPDRGSRFAGLGNYGVRGLGDDSVDLSTLYPTGGNSSSLDLSQLYPLGTTGADATVSPSLPATGGAPAGGGGWWQSVLGNELSAFTKIAGNVIAPQQTIQRGPGGQLLITGPASSTPSTGTAASLLSSSASSWLPIVLIAGVAIFAFSQLSKK